MRILLEWTGCIDFIKDVSDNKVFVGKYSNLRIWISKSKNIRTIENYGTFNQEYIGTKACISMNKFNN